MSRRDPQAFADFVAARSEALAGRRTLSVAAAVAVPVFLGGGTTQRGTDRGLVTESPRREPSWAIGSAPTGR